MDKEYIRATLSGVTRNRSVADIARDLNIPASRLYDFLSKGKLGKTSLVAIEEWLIAHEYLPEQTLSREEILSGQLRLTAAILVSPDYSNQEKSAAIAALKRLL